MDTTDRVLTETTTSRWICNFLQIYAEGLRKGDIKGSYFLIPNTVSSVSEILLGMGDSVTLKEDNDEFSIYATEIPEIDIVVPKDTLTLLIEHGRNARLMDNHEGILAMIQIPTVDSAIGSMPMIVMIPSMFDILHDILKKQLEHVVFYTKNAAVEFEVRNFSENLEWLIPDIREYFKPVEGKKDSFIFEYAGYSCIIDIVRLTDNVQPLTGYPGYIIDTNTDGYNSTYVTQDWTVQSIQPDSHEKITAQQYHSHSGRHDNEYKPGIYIRRKSKKFDVSLDGVLNNKEPYIHQVWLRLEDSELQREQLNAIKFPLIKFIEDGHCIEASPVWTDFMVNLAKQATIPITITFE